MTPVMIVYSSLFGCGLRHISLCFFDQFLAVALCISLWSACMPAVCLPVFASLLRSQMRIRGPAS